jgi:hypothetical protein
MSDLVAISLLTTLTGSLSTSMTAFSVEVGCSFECCDCDGVAVTAIFDVFDCDCDPEKISRDSVAAGECSVSISMGSSGSDIYKIKAKQFVS